MEKRRFALNFENCKTLQNLYKIGLKKQYFQKTINYKKYNCEILKSQEQKMCTKVAHIKNLNLVGNVKSLENTHTHTHT
jgi:hypothetical protein